MNQSGSKGWHSRSECAKRAHLALTLLCLCQRPLVFLVDLQATLTQKNAQQHLVICLFAPWLFLLRAARPMHEERGEVLAIT